MDLAPTPSSLGLAPGSIVAVPANGEILWRITLGEDPVTSDFLSMTALGDPNRGPAILTLGVSMFSTRGQAARIRDRFRRDQHLVAVGLSVGRGFSLARTGKTPGHHTVWGEPDRLLAAALDSAG
jgi:hypothetical protein